MAEVYIRFETGQENRVSPEYGPFPFVQMTHSTLRVGPNGEDFAFIGNDEMWHRLGEAQEWSDMIIYSNPQRFGNRERLVWAEKVSRTKK